MLQKALSLQVVSLGSAALLNTPSGAGRVELLVITSPCKYVSNAQMSAPLGAGGAEVLVITPLGTGRAQSETPVVG